MSLSESPVSAPVNTISLTGVLIDTVKMRSMPSGQAMASMQIEHQSPVTDLSPLKHLEVRLNVMAFGNLAKHCQNLIPGMVLHVEGSFNQKRWIREQKTRWGPIELVARRIVNVL